MNIIPIGSIRSSLRFTIFVNYISISIAQCFTHFEEVLQNFFLNFFVTKYLKLLLPNKRTNIKTHILVQGLDCCKFSDITIFLRFSRCSHALKNFCLSSNVLYHDQYPFSHHVGFE